MRQQSIGGLIGATMGTVFVLVNSNAPLDSTLGIVLKVLAVLALAAFVALLVKIAKRPVPEGRGGHVRFTKGYWIVVAAEVVLLFGGFQVLRAMEAPTEANVAWIAFIVGVHFIAFVPVWKTWTIAVPGVIMSILGVIGLVLASTSAFVWVPLVSGVLSGFTLLTSTLGFTAVQTRESGN